MSSGPKSPISTEELVEMQTFLRRLVDPDNLEMTPDEARAWSVYKRLQRSATAAKKAEDRDDMRVTLFLYKIMAWPFTLPYYTGRWFLRRLARKRKQTPVVFMPN